MDNYPRLKNDLLLRAARGEPTERAPVWIMRQAGRHLPEYREVREKYDFFTVCQTPELAAKVTLQPVDRYPLDAAIIFSDILVIPQAIGLEVQMVSGKGPHFPDPLGDPDEIARLTTEALDDRLSYVYDALSLTRERLNGRVPLIGFAGAPWTLMAYMLGDRERKHFINSKRWLWDHPDRAEELLQLLVDALETYLVGQAQAGAQVLQVFDSWLGALDPHTIDHLIRPHLIDLANRVKTKCPDVPLIFFPKGAPSAIASMAESSFDVISVDWTVTPEEARRAVDGNASVQGNLDPAVLYARPEVIREHTERMIAAFEPHGHIVNLGHGLHKNHDPEHVRTFIETGQEFSKTYYATVAPIQGS